MSFSTSELTKETKKPYVIRSIIFTALCMSIIFLVDFDFEMKEKDFKNILGFLMVVNWIINVSIRHVFIPHPYISEDNGVHIEEGNKP